jgi:hypothetical protein
MKQAENHLNDMISLLKQCEEGKDVSKLIPLLGRQFSRLSSQEQGEFSWLWLQQMTTGEK